MKIKSIGDQNHRDRGTSRSVITQILTWLALWAPALNLIAEVTITQHPQSTTVSLGATVTLTVLASSAEPPLTYRWQHDGEDLPDATLGSLVLTNINQDHAGAYTVVVGDAQSSKTGNPAMLGVDSTFRKITEGDLVTDQFPSIIGAWFDIDGDGVLEVIVSNNTPPPGNQYLPFYRNTGDGIFNRFDNPISQAHVGRSAAIGWGDMDNDGDPDLFVSNYGAYNEVFRNDGDGAFSKVSAGDVTSENGLHFGFILGDFDADGWIDIFMAYEAVGPYYLLHNLGNGSFERRTAGDLSLPDNPPIQAVHLVDYDRDGDLDISTFPTRGSANAARLYQNDGTGQFKRVLVGSLTSMVLSRFGHGYWADYNNDGFVDCFANNVPNGGYPESCALFRNEGGTNFVEVAVAAGLAQPLPWSPAAWGDYDNDGDLDLFLSNVLRADNGLQNVFYLNNGDGTFTKTEVGSPLRDGVLPLYANWVDYDNDGFVDLFIPCGDSNSGALNQLYQNNLPATGNTNRWLKISLAGALSNRSAIGAVVHVLARIGDRDVWQMRPITATAAGSTGLLSLIGLGDANVAEIVRIEWPSGIAQELTNVAARQMFTVTEPTIGVSPRSATVSLGEDLTLSVIWTNVTPSSYQWFLNESIIRGATQPTLSIVNFQDSHTGKYTVSMFDGTQRVTSQPILVLTEPRAPIVMQIVTNYSVVQGGSITLSLEVDGSFPISYSWRRNSQNLKTETLYSHQSLHALDNVQPEMGGSANRYRVVITNPANFAPGVLSPSIYLTVLPDSDGDLMPDEWETAHGLDPGRNDAQEDKDEDHLTNIEEYQSGTDPADALSFLKVDRFKARGGVQIEFMAAENVTYTVFAKDNLDGAPWQKLADVIAGPARKVTLTDSAGLPGSYYKLASPRQP